MTNVVQFPNRDGIAIIEGTESGTPIFLIEHICGGSRTIVGEYRTHLEVAQATAEWEQDGVPLVASPFGGAA